MGRRGPMPKHPSKRQNRNRPSSVVLVHSIGVPDPPEGLLPELVDAWAAFWRSEISRIVSEEDVPALVRLFRMRDEWERCRRVVAEEPVVRGSQGQPVEHPLAKRMDRLLGELGKLEDRFGLNPSSRARLAVSLGDVQRTVEDLYRGGDDDELRILDSDASS